MKLFIVLPVRDEEKIIERNVDKVVSFMKKQRGYSWHLMVAENGSRDDTLTVLEKLSKKYSKNIFSFKSFPSRFSKSDAIRAAWLSEEADIYMYMDADLSTDIRHIPELIKEMHTGYDLVIGSRSLKDSKSKRSKKRNFISFGYNIIARLLFSLNISDLQCGFKAVNKMALNEIIKRTKYTSQGFMDTEALILACHKNFKIKELPVRWTDYRKSHFNFLTVAIKFIENMLKVKRDLILGRYK